MDAFLTWVQQPLVTWGAENLATVLGVAGVIFQIKRHPACFPLGIGWAALSTIPYYNSQLYSDLLLMVIYVGLLIYGWAGWVMARGGGDAVPVRFGGWRLTAILVGVGALLTAAWGTLMDRATDAAFPYLDACTTMFNLVAQYATSARLFECWYFWIGVNTLAIYIYMHRDLPSFTVLYAVFLAMAGWGAWEWWRSLGTRAPE